MTWPMTYCWAEPPAVIPKPSHRDAESGGLLARSVYGNSPEAFAFGFVHRYRPRKRPRFEDEDEGRGRGRGKATPSRGRVQSGQKAFELAPRQAVDVVCRPRGRPASGAAEAFTLIELLVVVAVIAILAGLLLPVLAKCKAQAQSAQCIGNLRQLGLAARMYWDDFDNTSFRYRNGVTNGGVTYWFGWMQNGREGQRAFDPQPGALYPYLLGRGVELCPTLNYALAQFKLKATGAAYGYGYNRHLSNVHLNRVRNPADLVVLADAAQINTFQPPASPEHPMLEEFYYVSDSAYEATAHFRHSQAANAAFCDGHVAREEPVPGSLDARLPRAWVGRLRPEALQVP